MIKVVAFDLIGVLIKEKDIDLLDDEEKIERLFGPNKSNEEFINLAKEIIGDDKKVVTITNNIINKLYEIRQDNVFERLKERYPNIKLVIVTNHVSYVRDYINKTFNKDLIDNIIISADIGKIKPNIDFYQYILNSLDILPSELLFLDDNKDNIAGASNIGINTIKIEKTMDLIDEINKFIIDKKD